MTTYVIREQDGYVKRWGEEFETLDAAEARLAVRLEADPGMSGLLRIVQVSELPDEPV